MLVYKRYSRWLWCLFCCCWYFLIQAFGLRPTIVTWCFNTELHQLIITYIVSHHHILILHSLWGNFPQHPAPVTLITFHTEFCCRQATDMRTHSRNCVRFFRICLSSLVKKAHHFGAIFLCLLWAVGERGQMMTWSNVAREVSKGPSCNIQHSQKR